MTNCIDICPYVGEDGMCNGECKTIKPIETLTDDQIERGASPSLKVIDDMANKS